MKLVNLYGHNKDFPGFYIDVNNKLQQLGNPYVIAVYIVVNPSIDYLHVNSPKSRDVVLDTMVNTHFNDFWRDLNFKKNEFTWFKQMKRVDSIFFSYIL